MLEKQLQELGLAEKESRVYLAALELGSASVQDIAHKAGVNRPTTYVQIEFLAKKGLMSSFIRGKKRYFNAESPEQLMRILDKKKKEIENKQDELEKSMPELKSLHNLMEDKPKVRYFEGKEGLKAIQQDILRTDIKVVKEVTNIDNFQESEDDHYRNKVKEKLKNIPVQVIYTSKEGSIKAEKEGNRKRLFVPLEKFDFPSEIMIYGKNKVAFINPTKTNGVIVENDDIFNTLNSLFDLAWKK